MQRWCAPACESGPTSAEGGASLDSVPYTFVVFVSDVAETVNVK